MLANLATGSERFLFHVELFLFFLHQEEHIHRENTDNKCKDAAVEHMWMMERLLLKLGKTFFLSPLVTAMSFGHKHHGRSVINSWFRLPLTPRHMFDTICGCFCVLNCRFLDMQSFCASCCF